MIIVVKPQPKTSNNRISTGKIIVTKNHSKCNRECTACVLMLITGIAVLTFAIAMFIDMANGCVGYMEEWNINRDLIPGANGYHYQFDSPKSEMLKFKRISVHSFAIALSDSLKSNITFTKVNANSSDEFWPSWKGITPTTNISLVYSDESQRFKISFNSTEWTTNQISSYAIPGTIEIADKKDKQATFPSRISLLSKSRLCITRKLSYSQKVIILGTAITYSIG
tara:strand:+ start:80 stop:754 length:675 start_codon:yes stop_codon:yes gene_type:complete